MSNGLAVSSSFARLFALALVTSIALACSAGCGDGDGDGGSEADGEGAGGGAGAEDDNDGTGGRGRAGGAAGASDGDPATAESEATSAAAPASVRVNGPLELRTDIAARVSACAAAGREDCADADGDGLVDAWESRVLERFRPAVTFDEDEPLLRAGSSDSFAMLGRVAPFGTKIFVNVLLLYTRDYGAAGRICPDRGDHPGDVERVALELELVANGGAGDARVTRAFTTGHEGSSSDQSKLFAGAQLSSLEYVASGADGRREPRWRVYSSQSKHATYATKKLCESAKTGIAATFCTGEDCAPDGVKDPGRFTRIPVIANAGENGKPLLDDLGRLGFRGERAWADVKFCGGVKVASRDECVPSVKSKLLANPFK